MTTVTAAPADLTKPHEPGAAAPSAAAAPSPDGAERRVRLRGATPEGVCSVLGAAAGALALTWVLYERVLPLSGALGFWLSWYGVFVALYWAIGRTQWDPRTVRENTVRVMATTAGLLVVALIADQIGFVTYRGLHASGHLNFFTQDMKRTASLSPITSGGALNAIVGSLEQLGLATLFAVPLGITAAVFMSEVGGRLAKPVRTVVEAMTALPSIVAGLFVLGVVILGLGMSKCGFAASLALTVMMMPIVTRAAEVVIRLVPGTLREASYALGASQWRTVWSVVLPTARPGLVTAVVLGMARGVGETSPVLLTAGFSAQVNANPFSGPQVSLPLYVWNYVRYPPGDMVARGFAAAMTLMAVVLVLFVTARLLGGHRPGQLSRRQRRRIDRDAEKAAAAARAADLDGRSTVQPTALVHSTVAESAFAEPEGDS